MHISYASPDQTTQDRYQQTLETAGDKGQIIKKGITNNPPTAIFFAYFTICYPTLQEQPMRTVLRLGTIPGLTS